MNYGVPNQQDAYEALSELSFHLWRPSEDDSDLLLAWLSQCPLSSLKHRVARRVLSAMKWEEVGALPLSLHQSVAEAVVKVSLALEASHASDGLLQSGRRHVMEMTAGETEERRFSSWGRALLSKLRLHSCDREDRLCALAVEGQREAFTDVLDLDRSEALRDGVEAGNELGLFAALQVPSDEQTDMI